MPQQATPTPSRAPRRLDWRIVLIFVLLAISIPVLLIVQHGSKNNPIPIASSTAQRVAAARVTREDLFNEVSVSAEFRPFAQVELHSKISGYVESISVDIGDRVKAGQLLAKLEVPELKNELDRALAAQKRAEADYKDAHLAYTRLLAVEKAHPNLVAQQELDAAEAKDNIAEAQIAAAKAESERYQTLQAYTKISAPFDGVITHRYADPGSLIQAGTSSDTQSRPLVRLSDNYKLRLDFPVSVSLLKELRLDDSVEVHLDSLGGKVFEAKISRCTRKVDEATRSMMVELEVPNPNLEIVPGMYATVVLKMERRPKALTVPTEAVAIGESSSVYLINAADEIEERPVTLGLETPHKCEIASGLKEGDLVMLGSRSLVKPGQKVETKISTPLAKQ